MYLKSFNSKQLFLSECKLESKLNILFWLTNAMLAPGKQNDRYRRSSIKEKGIYEKINKTILLLNYDSSPFLPLANRFQQHNLSIFFIECFVTREKDLRQQISSAMTTRNGLQNCIAGDNGSQCFFSLFFIYLNRKSDKARWFRRWQNVSHLSALRRAMDLGVWLKA